MESDIYLAQSNEDFEEARMLISEYFELLGNRGLDISSYVTELSELKKKYSKQVGGALLLASIGDQPQGCCSIQKLSEDTCELKRMFIRSAHRGSGVGQLLLWEAMNEAKHLGYSYLRLDILPEMNEAIHIYKKAGFKEITWNKEHSNKIYMEVDLYEF